MGRLLLESDSEDLDQDDRQQIMEEMYVMSVIDEAAERCASDATLFEKFMVKLHYYAK